MNEELETILDRNELNSDFSGAYYGNIGKCLEFLNRKNDALYCYIISLKLLYKEDVTNTIINRGYASF